MKFKTSKKIYLHIDCDSFFASCEELRNPDIRGKYVCVGDEIIIACSYEAKKLGIYTGLPVWEAKKILKKQGIFIKPDLFYYGEVSINFINFLEKYTFNIEQFSIDEAFCEITGLPEYFKQDLDKYLKLIQYEIYKNIGIKVSIGCANTKIKAKIFSKLNKPFGIFNGFNVDIKELYQNLELKTIPFIGKKTEQKLKYKAKTIYDYMKIGFWTLDDLIGKIATDLWLELAGVDVFKVKKSNNIQSISRSRSFNSNKNNDIPFLKNELIKNFEHVFRQITDKDFLVKNIGILLRDREFNTYYYHTILPDYTNNRTKILEIVYKIFDFYYNPELTYRSTGVVFSDFKPFFPNQLSVFEIDNMFRKNNYNFNKLFLDLNNKYGNNVLKFGTTNIKSNKLKTRFIN